MEGWFLFVLKNARASFPRDPIADLEGETHAVLSG